MIHVCFLISSLANEGPTNVMYNIIKYMDRDKFRISVITLIPEKSNSRLEEFGKLGIDIYQLSVHQKLSMISLYKALKRVVASISPDCLHAHCARSLYLMCFLPRKYKRIYTVHIFPGYQQIQILGPIKGRIVTALNNFFTRKCDLPIGCAKSVGQMYNAKKGWNLKCIPNGASAPVLSVSCLDKNSKRQDLGLQMNIVYFVFIGRFSKEKNPDVLIDVFNSLPNKDIGLIMLGDGPMWKELHDRASEKIVMPGFTTHVYDYLQAADFYISLSDVEGLANTLLESMSIGLPMVLSNIPSHNEVMDNFAKVKVGEIVNQHDMQNVIVALNEVKKLDWQETSKEIRRVYQSVYTAQVMSESYQKEYMSIINK